MPARTAYHDELGDHFARHADTSPYNAYVDRPAMLALAGDVGGQRILDVGCGAGHYAAELLSRGAEDPLDFIDDASFDGVVCALTLHHVANRQQLLGELRRVLRPGGWLLVSTTHPTADWRHFGGSYFADDWVDLPLAGGQMSIHYQRMTLETFLGELLDAGLRLERFVEPRPVSSLRDVDEAAYHKLRRSPSFVAVRLRRP